MFYYSANKSANTHLSNIYTAWNLGWIDLQLQGTLDFSICGAFKERLKGKLKKMNTNTQNTIPLMKSSDFNLCNKGIRPCDFNFAIMQNIAMVRMFCVDCNFMSTEQWIINSIGASDIGWTYSNE